MRLISFMNLKNQEPNKNGEKVLTYENDFLMEEKKSSWLFWKLKIFLTRKKTHQREIKILTPKQMLERLPLVFAQVKAGNTSRFFASSKRSY